MTAATPGPAPRDLQAEQDCAEFTGWAEAQSYDESFEFNLEDMADAFAAGMHAQRDLAAAQQPPRLATVDLHRWYAVICQPDGTSKVIGHTDDGLGYYDSVDEWEARNS